MKRWITWMGCAALIGTLALAQAGCAKFSDKFSKMTNGDYPSASPATAEFPGRTTVPPEIEAP